MATTVQQLREVMPDTSQILSDEPEMESSQHLMQMMLLVRCLDWHWRDRNDYFIGANLTIYFDIEQIRSRSFRGPDFFLVRDTQKRPRASWVVWEEGGRYPDLIVELLSDTTEDVDRGLKKEIYQSIFRTPEYFWYSPKTQEFAGFRLVEQEYEEILATSEGWRWSKVLELYLGVVDGRLRYITADGVVVPTPDEEADEEHKRALEERHRVDKERLRAEEAQQRAEQERQRADQEQQRAEEGLQQAERERQRAEALAARLRELGVDPDLLSG
jgi:Uma2 family endonuclease